MTNNFWNVLPSEWGSYAPPLVDHSEGIRELKKFYSAVDLHDLEKRIEDFFEADWDSENFDIVSAATGVIKVSNHETWGFNTAWDEIPAANLLWRARKVTEEQLHAGLEEADLWEPPPKAVQFDGRYNKAEESLLYLTLGASDTPLHEISLREGEPFILICYEVVRPFNVTRVGKIRLRSNLTRHELRVAETISTFLAHIMARPTAGNEEATYKNTNRILEEFFPLDPLWTIGWRYASTVANQEQAVSNLALKPQLARKFIEVSGVIAAKVNQVKEGQYLFTPHAISNGKRVFNRNISWQYMNELPCEHLEFWDCFKYVLDLDQVNWDKGSSFFKQ